LFLFKISQLSQSPAHPGRDFFFFTSQQAGRSLKPLPAMLKSGQSPEATNKRKTDMASNFFLSDNLDQAHLPASFTVSPATGRIIKAIDLDNPDQSGFLR